MLVKYFVGLWTKGKAITFTLLEDRNMADKSKGRKKFTFSAEERDKKESIARRVNKGANNRLRFQQERANGHQEMQLSDIKREVQLLRRELKDIKQTKEIIESPRRKPKYHKHLRTYPNILEKESSDSIQIKREETAEFTSDQIIKKGLATSLPNLPVIASCVANGFSEQTNDMLKKPTDSELTNRDIDKTKYTEDSEATEAPLKKDTDFALKRFASFPNKKDVNDEEVIKVEEKPSTKWARRQSKSEGSLATLNLDNVKNNINKRLSISSNNNAVSSPSSSSPDEVVDPTPYLYAPPDGLPRTMFLIPPLEEMLLEAKKARYIRHPRKRLDPMSDPERELDIHEIFDKRK